MDMPVAPDTARKAASVSPFPLPACRDESAVEPIKLIYICGYGRSGSTLLDILLGQQRSMFGAGEITALSEHVYANDEYCACGRRVRSCALWQEVMDRWVAGQEPGFVERYFTLQSKIARLFGVRRWLGGRKGSEFASHTRRLMQAIRDSSGKAVIVDSSKLPGRGIALAGIKGIDLHIIHLVRDVRGVAWSLSKSYTSDAAQGLQRAIVSKPLLYSAARWAYVNLASEWLGRRVGASRYLRIRYEDVIDDPVGSLKRIAALAGVELDAQDFAAGAFSPAHQVAGNRLRMQKAIRIAKDEGWQREMPKGKRRIVSWACRPLLARYGYPIDAPGPAPFE
ncbi:sulfotransferase family protein [Sphingobium bisphenolivorans]|uniref:sulfotransferase family protein n=1 Tax=Sphingobium bisphenolivorans TaxID=1335760 RepID=UPI0003A916E4|nr:sulfotransferase [Sphingobium bisphenolivorans]